MDFFEWLNQKGEDFMRMHTNNVSNGNPLSFEGAYALGQDEEARENLLEQNLQNATDSSNTLKGSMTFSELISLWQKGEITPLEIQTYVAEHGMRLRPSEEAWLNNVLNIQSTQSDRDFQTDMRDTSLLSSYEQLVKLGLNPGSVVNVGGANSGVSSSATKLSTGEVSKMMFDRRTAMAQTMIRLAGGLASTGVHGAALGAAKFAASKLTSEASKYATDMKYGHVKTSYYDPDNKSTHTFYTY